MEAITCDDITTTAQANTDSYPTVDTEMVSCGKGSNYCCVGWNMEAVGLPVCTRRLKRSMVEACHNIFDYIHDSELTTVVGKIHTNSITRKKYI